VRLSSANRVGVLNGRTRCLHSQSIWTDACHWSLECVGLWVHEPGNLVCVPLSHMDNATLSWRLHALGVDCGRRTDVLSSIAVHVDVDSDATVWRRIHLGKSNPLSSMGPGGWLGSNSGRYSMGWRLYLLGDDLGIQYGLESTRSITSWISICKQSSVGRGRPTRHNLR